MKPKFQSFRHLPLAIFVASSMTAQAAIFNDDTAGNAQPTSADNGATSILADGGTSSTPFVIIGSDVSMTGSVAPVTTYVLQLSNGPYTVTNNGSLAGSASHDGIQALSAFTLTNSGTISSSSALFFGINTVGSSTLNNNSTGVISGALDDAIHFTSSFGTVSNSGIIQSAAGGSGIDGQSFLEVTNTGTGTISGALSGIQATTFLTLTNGNAIFNGTPTISSGAGNAVNASTFLTADNFGSISGFGHGINADSFATINNHTTTDGFGNLVDGGSIVGGAGSSGVNATNFLTLVNENLGEITGGLNGVTAQGFATITNNAGGTITGTNGTGAYLGDSALVTNNGRILGNTVGLRVGGGTSTVNNGGTISGILGIEAYAGAGSTFTLNNSSVVTGTGGTAIDGLWGTDLINLNAGSLITGDVRGENGDDTFYLDSDTGFGGGSSTVIGSVLGGNGIDTLTFQDGQTTSFGTRSIITGNVTGMEDVIKNGDGVSFIGAPGANSTVTSDAVHVNNGDLFINGNLDGMTALQSTVSVSNSLIGGNGVWDANISVVDGGITAGGTSINVAETLTDSIGTLQVTGDVTLNGYSFYRWDVDPHSGGAGHDLIALSGGGNVFTTNFAEFRISPTNVNTPLVDGARTVVSTDSALVGSFDNIAVAFSSNVYDSGPFFANYNNPILEGFSTLVQTDSGTDWTLLIEHRYDLFGNTPNERKAGVMLNGLANIDSGDSDYDPFIADLLAAMDYSDPTVTEAVLAALDPSSYFATSEALANNNYRLHRSVETHNAAVRASSGATTTTTTGGYSTGAKGAVVSAPTVTTSSCGASNVWGSFSYDWQDFNADDSNFDSDGETGSFTAGIDFTIANNFRLGLVAEGSRTSWDGDAANSDIDSYRFAAYANWGEATGWFVDALVGYNTHSIDQDRSIGLGVIGVADTFSNSYDADGWQAFVNVGHAFQTGMGLVSPFIGVEWQQLNVDGFDEGDGLFALDDYNVDSLRGLAGVKWEMGLGASATLYATAAYAHEFQDGGDDVTVTFGPGSYEAEGLDRSDSVLLSAGLRWGVTDCTTIDFGYRGELGLGDNGLDSHGANVGVNYAF